MLRTSIIILALLFVSVTASSAAPDEKRPRIVAAALGDSDGDSRADRVRLTYSERVRHARDRDGRYPFAVAGYKVRAVSAAIGRRIVLKLAEKRACDPGAEPAVLYRRTASKPVRDHAGNQAARQLFARTSPHENSASNVNLALGKPTTSSSVEEPTTLGPERAVDGNSSTRWSSSFADDQWWQVDLGAATTIGTITLDWEFAYASQYKIQTSRDGVIFSDRATVINDAPGLKTTALGSVTARYVRVLGVTRATGYGISFWEAELYAC